MAYRGQGQKVQKVMVQPINPIFRYLQNRSRIQAWLYEQVNMRIKAYSALTTVGTCCQDLLRLCHGCVLNFGKINFLNGMRPVSDI
uniref:Uncharacterized protein n=1 Tax=Cebus imitator TaxID=2715852 RepID=A0A2K5QZ12_CEBIM